ncbi:MAG: hypothetical protein GX554_02350 [Elusimicrobia bacterium]|nr:hypothetical protein [Elusimicrobiota bacterium]
MKDKEMGKGRKRTDILREEKKNRLLNFIEQKSLQNNSSVENKIIFQKNGKENNTHVNKEKTSKGTDKLPIEGTNRNKTRKEKRDEIKKKRALAVLQKKQNKEEAIRRKKEEIQQKKLEALKRKEEARELKEAQRQAKKAVKPVSPKDITSTDSKEPTPVLLTTTPQAVKKRRLFGRSILKKEEQESNKILEQTDIEKKKDIIPSNEEKQEIKAPAEISPETAPAESIPAVLSESIAPHGPDLPVEDASKESIVPNVSDSSQEGISMGKDAGSEEAPSLVSKKRISPVFFKKRKERPQQSVSDAPEKKTVVKYKEPFLLMQFIRRNIFKFIFLLLLLAWVYEVFFFIRQLDDSQVRLTKIVGRETSEQIPVALPSESSEEEKLPVTEEEFKIALKREKINIEGERDPFSPGRLTMKVLEKPEAKSIVLASKPSVISILRPLKDVSILKEEKLQPEKISTISKSTVSAYQPILKDKTTEPALIMPEKRPNLAYRGRMVLEGIEYLFIEGADKTYRVTVGDTVEGFRVLKKEKQTLILSKEGIIYEIPAD